MAQMKRVKSTYDKLNARQKEALVAARSCNYLPLIQCCLECTTAIDKAFKAIEQGVTKWGENTMQHYLEVRAYLEVFIEDDDAWKQYQLEIKRRESNG